MTLHFEIVKSQRISVASVLKTPALVNLGETPAAFISPSTYLYDFLIISFNNVSKCMYMPELGVRARVCWFALPDLRLIVTSQLLCVSFHLF